MRPIPGFGGTFPLSKYPPVGSISECNQILTEIFDYIRCLNLNDQSSQVFRRYPSICTDRPTIHLTILQHYAAWQRWLP